MKSHTPQLGFSIIEMMITTAVISIVFLLAANFLLNGLNIQRYTSQQNEAIAESRKALKIMSSEMREMISSDTGAYPIESVSEQSITFFGDIDHDTYTERIRYFLDGTNLKRGVTEPSGEPLVYNTNNEVVTIFSEYIQNGMNPIFYYYNESYPEDTENNPLSGTIDVTEIRLIEIVVDTNVDPNRIPDTRELQSAVQLRNVKENF